MMDDEEEKPIWMGWVGLDEQLVVVERAEEIVEVDIVQCRAASFIHVGLWGGWGVGWGREARWEAAAKLLFIPWSRRYARKVSNCMGLFQKLVGGALAFL
jgi:hypothetical protein